MRWLLAAALAVATSSCIDAAGPHLWQGWLRADLRPDGLHLENSDARPAYVFAVEGATVMAINWTPCVQPEQCLSVPARGTSTIPNDGILGWHERAKTLHVYWWHLVPDGPGEFRPDSVRWLGVRRE